MTNGVVSSSCDFFGPDLFCLIVMFDGMSLIVVVVVAVVRCVHGVLLLCPDGYEPEDIIDWINHQSMGYEF